MYFVAVACVFNIILDYVFIGFFKLGAAGAALGTTLSQTVSVIISLAAIHKKQMLPKITKSDLKPDRATMGSLLKIGIPVAVQDGFIQVSFIVITIFATALSILNLEPSVFLFAAQYVPARSIKFNASPGRGALLITKSFSLFFFPFITSALSFNNLL